MTNSRGLMSRLSRSSSVIGHSTVPAVTSAGSGPPAGRMLPPVQVRMRILQSRREAAGQRCLYSVGSIVAHQSIQFAGPPEDVGNTRAVDPSSGRHATHAVRSTVQRTIPRPRQCVAQLLSQCVQGRGCVSRFTGCCVLTTAKGTRIARRFLPPFFRMHANEPPIQAGSGCKVPLR